MDREIDIEVLKSQSTKIWFCKIGEINRDSLPDGSDLPMRVAIGKAYREVTGKEPDFIFSGWAGILSDAERSVVDDGPVSPSA